MDAMAIVKFLGAFAIVIALIITLGALLRRAPFVQSMQTRKSAGGSLVLKDSLFLDPKNKCLVVQWGQKEHLLLLSPNHVKVVASRDVLGDSLEEDSSNPKAKASDAYEHG